jgi:hypothetical protein
LYKHFVESLGNKKRGTGCPIPLSNYAFIAGLFVAASQRFITVSKEVLKAELLVGIRITSRLGA